MLAPLFGGISQLKEFATFYNYIGLNKKNIPLFHEENSVLSDIKLYTH